MANTQNVQNVQNIQNIQHNVQPGQSFQVPPMPGQTNMQVTQPPQFAQPSQGGAQMPQSGAQMPQSGTQMPQSGAQMPQSGAQMPQSGAQMPQSGTQMPQNGMQMPQNGAQMPQDGAQTAENSGQTIQGLPMKDWSTEISPLQSAQDQGETHPTFVPIMRSELAGSSGLLDMRTHVPDEVLESPTTVSEAYLGSMKAMLARNRGNFVVATFLIGTQGTTTWEGLLYDVGNDYLIIHQMGRDRYIACDLYSLKYIEFYDTQRKEVCDNLMWQNGWQSGC